MEVSMKRKADIEGDYRWTLERRWTPGFMDAISSYGLMPLTRNPVKQNRHPSGKFGWRNPFPRATDGVRNRLPSRMS